MPTAQDELLEHRRELAARKRELRAEMKSVSDDLATIDRVLRMLDPKLIAPEAPRQAPGKLADGLFADGELATGTLTALRDLGRPATTADCATVLARSKGLEEGDPRLPEITNRVSATLGNLAKKDRVRRVGNGDGRTILWEIAREKLACSL